MRTNGKAHRPVAAPAVTAPSVTPPAGCNVVCYVPAIKSWLCEGPTEVLLKMCPPWNPKERTDPASSRSGLASLAKSIVTHGLLQLPVCNGEVMLDGSRRTAASAIAGVKMMHFFFRPDLTAAAFADANVERRPHTNVQRQETWRTNPAAVTCRFNASMQYAAEVLGEDLVNQLIEGRHDVQTILRFGHRAATYCEIKPRHLRPFLVHAARMMSRHCNTYAVRQWMDAGKPRCDLKRLILRERRID